MADKYNHQEIEKKWQAKWAQIIFTPPERQFQTQMVALTMFPYTSGDCTSDTGMPWRLRMSMPL
jgi:leucyl-tRNA synthetase